MTKCLGSVLLFVFLSPLAHADSVKPDWNGTYTCRIGGHDRPVNLEFRDQQLVLQGINEDWNEPLPCANQNLTRNSGGAVYTYVTTCGERGISRALTLDRPESLEQFSIRTDIQPISARELNIHVLVKFTGTADQDLVMNCWK